MNTEPTEEERNSLVMDRHRKSMAATWMNRYEEEIDKNKAVNAAILAIRKNDCGAWLKENADGHQKRIELMKLLDELYKVANIPCV
jgi:hypothetical protein